MNKKAVFLDIDGTMVNSQGHIPESTKTAIKLAKENGHKMVICSGRSRFQIYDKLLALGFSGIVGSAGAFVIADDKEIFHACIDEAHRKSVYEYLENNGFYYCFQADEGIELNQRSADGILEIYKGIGMSEARLNRLVGNMHLTEEPWKNPKSEKLLYYNSPFPVEKVHADLAPYFDAVVISLPGLDATAGEIGIGGIDKATGMENYLKHVGIPREDSIAIGDAENDLPMLKYAGLSVSMGNAKDCVKVLADMVTDHIDKDGIYNAFVKLRLI